MQRGRAWPHHHAFSDRQRARIALGSLKRDNLMPRLGDHQDIANAVLFLVSDESSFITGQIFRVDGGQMAHLPHFSHLMRHGLALQSGQRKLLQAPVACPRAAPDERHQAALAKASGFQYPSLPSRRDFANTVAVTDVMHLLALRRARHSRFLRQKGYLQTTWHFEVEESPCVSLNLSYSFLKSPSIVWRTCNMVDVTLRRRSRIGLQISRYEEEIALHVRLTGRHCHSRLRKPNTCGSDQARLCPLTY